MLPHQFIGVSVRRIWRKIKQPHLAAETGDERLGLLGNMGGAAIDDQKPLPNAPFTLGFRAFKFQRFGFLSCRTGGF
jgi:hypothetical protein